MDENGESAFNPVPKIRRARVAQDGHSHTEQAVYDALWAQGELEDSGNRIVTIGLGALAQAARVSLSTCRISVRSLVSKLAVAEVAPENSHRRTGKTYRVFSYKEILKRRRSAGYEWVIRAKRVSFVDAINGTPFTVRAEMSSHDMSSKNLRGHGAPTSGVEATSDVESKSDRVTKSDEELTSDSRTTFDVEPTSDVYSPSDFKHSLGIDPTLPIQPESGSISTTATNDTSGAITNGVAALNVTPASPIVLTSLLKESIRKEEKQAPSAVSLIIQTSSRFGVALDDIAAEHMLNSCRSFDSSATVDEVAHFVGVKLNQVGRSANIHNPVGLLLAAVPSFFRSPATELSRWRSERNRPQRAPDGNLAEDTQAVQQYPIRVPYSPSQPCGKCGRHELWILEPGGSATCACEIRRSETTRG